MKGTNTQEKEKLILHLIKSCENFGLKEKDSIEAINSVLDKRNISRRTYYNYKKKIFKNNIFEKLKGSCYDTEEMKLILLDCEENDWNESAKADKLIGSQFPTRKQVLEDTDKQLEKIENIIAEKKSIINNFNNYFEFNPENNFSENEHATIREEFVKCGKINCNGCPHGPYYYAYLKDDKNNRTRKQYIE